MAVDTQLGHHVGVHTGCSAGAARARLYKRCRSVDLATAGKARIGLENGATAWGCIHSTILDIKLDNTPNDATTLMNDSPASRDMFPPDLNASTRWQTRPGLVVPPSALHVQVAKNMALRLRALKQPPQLCLDWQPSVGGVLAQDLLKSEGFQAACQIQEPSAQRFEALKRRHRKPWWQSWPWAQRLRLASSVEGFDLVWSNLGLHVAHDPATWLKLWHQALAPNGCVVFSCFGPDTLRELQSVYAAESWPHPCQDWMDMHDWGDVLLKNGWKDPVMDVERFVLTYHDPEAVVRDLRDWGTNLHPQRFAACRSRHWLAAFKRALANRMSQAPDAQFKLTFEIVYGHAMRGEDRRSSHHVQSIPLSSLKNQLPSSAR